jgi:hypothetical protein
MSEGWWRTVGGRAVPVNRTQLAQRFYTTLHVIYGVGELLCDE